MSDATFFDEAMAERVIGYDQDVPYDLQRPHESGVTGYCAPSAGALPELVHGALGLDRAAVRQQAETRFSAARMVDDYLALYERIVAR